MSLHTKYMQVLNNLPTIVTDSVADTGRFSYKYLSLSALINAVKPAFQNAGCMFSQGVKYMGNEDGQSRIAIVTTNIFDENETLKVGEYPVPFNNDPQAMGSAITYARRYSLYLALNIYPEKDDDGYYAQQASTPHISQEQAQQITGFCEKHNLKPQAFSIISKAVGRRVKNLGEIQASEFDTVKSALVEAAK